MTIDRVETIILVRNVDSPVADALHVYDVGGHLLTRIYTTDGIVGSSVSYFGRIPTGMATVKDIVDGVLAPVLIGQNPHNVRKLRHEMFVATEYYGTIGVANFAIAAVDNALWDIKGKAAGLPVAELLGACRDSIPAYAMVGWYYDGGMKEFIKRCTEAADEGFRAVKLKVGRDALAEDVARIKAIRAELGDEFRIMVDANCAFDEAEALRRGRAYEQLGVFWFEEPIQPYQRDSHARLAQSLDIAIAVGENYYTRHQFYDVIKAGCADVIQPDNRRAGGVTEWMDIGTICDVSGIRLASHGGGPGNVNVLCAIESAIYIECGSLKESEGFYEHPMILKDGCLLIPQTPGMGTDLNKAYIEKYRVG